MNQQDYRAVIIEALKDIAPEADYASIDDAADLRDQLDLDSMDILNLVIGIHERTGIDVPERDYPRMATIAGGVRYLATHDRQAAKPAS